MSRVRARSQGSQSGLISLLHYRCGDLLRSTNIARRFWTLHNKIPHPLTFFVPNIAGALLEQMGFGPLHTVGLAEARELARQVRLLVPAGKSPSTSATHPRVVLAVNAAIYLMPRSAEAARASATSRLLSFVSPWRCRINSGAVSRSRSRNAQADLWETAVSGRTAGAGFATSRFTRRKVDYSVLVRR